MDIFTVHSIYRCTFIGSYMLTTADETFVCSKLHETIRCILNKWRITIAKYDRLGRYTRSRSSTYYGRRLVASAVSAITTRCLGRLCQTVKLPSGSSIIATEPHSGSRSEADTPIEDVAGTASSTLKPSKDNRGLKVSRTPTVIMWNTTYSPVALHLQDMPRAFF